MNAKKLHSPVGSKRRLERSFFKTDAESLAKALIGTFLVHRLSPQIEYIARIVETEAYVGAHDLACHASKGKTPRNRIMFGPAGFAYVYLCYGMYDLLNVVASKDADPQAVLIRAAEPISPANLDLSGPGKLTRALKIDRMHYGEDFTQDRLFFLKGRPARKIACSPRIGVDYAGAWKDAPLRFFDAESKCISAKGFSRKYLSTNSVDNL